MTTELNADLLGAASQFVEAQFGLHFPPDRWNELERGLRSAAVELGFERVEKYTLELMRAKLDRTQIDSLAEHLTIGETYFFRDPVVFKALAEQILPTLMQERQGRAKRLRIWSAGCCTGEEPYSIAITLRRTFPDLGDWHVTILGTDINPRFLHTANAGVYGPWSFRGVPEETRAEWFRPVSGGRFEVLPAIRRMVAFSCLNLVDDVYPSLAANTNAMDLIVCRNVLMYFSVEQLRKVVAKFHHSLIEGGHLIVGAAEAAREYFAGFTPVETPGVSLFKKGPPLALPAPVVLPAVPPITLSATLARRLPEPPPQLPAPKQEVAIAPPDHAAEAHRLAGEGRLAEALAACDRALVADKLVASHHYLRGVILQEQGALDEATMALKRALYLDPDFVIAHFALGHLMLKQSRAREAARCFTNARSLLRMRTPDALLPESDGITAGRLMEILTTMEAALG